MASILKIGGREGRKLIAKNKYGAMLELDPYDYIDTFVLRDGFYESEVFEAALDAMPTDGVFWDVGSNNGHHAISMAVCRPQATVIAFEPSVREIANIVSVARRNHAVVQVMSLALDETTGIKPFHICTNNRGRNALETWGDQRDYQPTLASCVKADDLTAAGYLPAPNVVKIDVEGAELRVLQGMQRTLQHPNCARVIFEASVDVLQSTNDINQLLTRYGFRVRQLARAEGTSHDLENFVADKLFNGSHSS